MIVSRLSVSPSRIGESARSWPYTVPAVSALVGRGLSLANAITFLVGENGTGKSTIVEAIADAYGLDSRGGHGGRKYAPAVEKGTLGASLSLEFAPGGREAKAGTSGYFLRSETALGVLEYMSDYGVPGYGDVNLAAVSHGESYLEVLSARFGTKGLFLLDEPEAGLSFQSSLALIDALIRTAAAGGQVICATHSPLLTAIPGASVLLASDDGLEAVEWGDLEMVQNWRRYLDTPDAYLRHLADD